MAANSFFTLSELQTQVGLNLGATDDVSLAKCGKYLNRALVRFAEMGIWSWQRVYSQPFPGATSVTVAGTSEYSVKNCLQIDSLYVTGTAGLPLTLMGDREFRAMYPVPTAQGRPYIYLERGRANPDTSNLDVLKVGLYPIPDAAYTLQWDGIKPISLMTSLSSDVRVVTGMPQGMVDILIEMATAIGWKEIDDAAAAIQMQEVVARLRAAFERDNTSIEDVQRFREPFADDYYRDPQLPPQYTR